MPDFSAGGSGCCAPVPRHPGRPAVVQAVDDYPDLPLAATKNTLKVITKRQRIRWSMRRPAQIAEYEREVISDALDADVPRSSSSGGALARWIRVTCVGPVDPAGDGGVALTASEFPTMPHRV
jgi:hypothetical protein